MKKAILLLLTMTMILSASACNNGSEPAPQVSDDTSLTLENSGQPEDDVTEESSEGLETEEPAESSEPSEDATAETSGTFDINSLITSQGGSALISALGDEEKQLFIDAAIAAGYNVEFGEDGSMNLSNAQTGDEIIQNSDGTWQTGAAEANSAQTEDIWPDNEYTQLIPKPDFAVTSVLENEGIFTASFAGTEADALRAYVEQLKASGFTVDAQESDTEAEGIAAISYIAKNADGYEVTFASAQGQSSLTVIKP
ncbi:MAG: hypothetical protein LBU32_15210 [Clostridiales bacterium]|jgi:hypothetical protein|nr:hypothetical protein [Clostridiales bacterium]